MADLDVPMGNDPNPSRALESQLRQAETDYIQLGLQFHCVCPSSCWSLKHVRKMRTAFLVSDTKSQNTFIATLEELHRNLQGKLCQSQLDKGEASLSEFRSRLSDVKSSLHELSALSGLQDLNISSANHDNADDSLEAGFRSNAALWSWVMDLPVVKGWLKSGEVKSEEHGFVKAVVRYGDDKSRKRLFWMGE